MSIYASLLTQFIDGFFLVQQSGNTGNGTNDNDFRYKDDAGNTYSRQVNAKFNIITLDEQSGNLAPAPEPSPLLVQDASFTGYSMPRLPHSIPGEV